jgi:hypothetical protein
MSSERLQDEALITQAAAMVEFMTHPGSAELLSQAQTSQLQRIADLLGEIALLPGTPQTPDAKIDAELDDIESELLAIQGRR